MWTIVALLHVMNLQMSHLGSRIRERFLTVVTVIGLLATMHQLVAFQIAWCGKKLAADLAAIPRFACVPFVVQVEQADLTVAFSTSRATVRLQRTWESRAFSYLKNPQFYELQSDEYFSEKLGNSPMCFLVSFASCRIRESFAAVSAAEWLLSCVNAHVSLEISCVSKFFSTVLKRNKYIIKCYQ